MSIYAYCDTVTRLTYSGRMYRSFWVNSSRYLLPQTSSAGTEMDTGYYILRILSRSHFLCLYIKQLVSSMDSYHECFDAAGLTQVWRPTSWEIFRIPCITVSVLTLEAPIFLSLLDMS